MPDPEFELEELFDPEALQYAEEGVRVDVFLNPQGGAFATGEPKSPTGILADGKKLPDKIKVVHTLGKLRAVLLGVCDNDVLPAWYPTPDGSMGNEVDGPPGQTKAEFSPYHFTRCRNQLNKFASLLEDEGIEVYRAPLTPLDIGKSDPVGLGATWAREEITVIGNNVIVNQTRTPHRRKELMALESFLSAIKSKFPDVNVVSPPATDWARNTDWQNDPRPFLEGGDIFHVGDKDILVTMSYLATSPTGFRWLADLLEPQGFNVWPAYLKSDENDWEHGDYVFMPIREGLVAAYLPAFVDGLCPSPCLDWTVVPLTLQEVNEKFQANGIVIRPNVVMIPEGVPRVVRALEKKGVDVIEVPCNDVTYWQGGPRCATVALWYE
jgi:N-dimethylarginine dimethylaminohydrolase